MYRSLADLKHVYFQFYVDDPMSASSDTENGRHVDSTSDSDGAANIVRTHRPPTPGFLAGKRIKPTQNLLASTVARVNNQIDSGSSVSPASNTSSDNIFTSSDNDNGSSESDQDLNTNDIRQESLSNDATDESSGQHKSYATIPHPNARSISAILEKRFTRNKQSKKQDSTGATSSENDVGLGSTSGSDQDADASGARQRSIIIAYKPSEKKNSTREQKKRVIIVTTGEQETSVSSSASSDKGIGSSGDSDQSSDILCGSHTPNKPAQKYPNVPPRTCIQTPEMIADHVLISRDSPPDDTNAHYMKRKRRTTRVIPRNRLRATSGSDSSTSYSHSVSSDSALCSLHRSVASNNEESCSSSGSTCVVYY